MPGEGVVPQPYRDQIEQFHLTQFGRMTARRDMRNASHASSNDGATPRLYRHNVLRLMESRSFAYAVIFGWTGYPPSRPFEPDLVEKTLIAALTNGPGTISAQAAMLSASAGNAPHTAMIATLAAIGDVHGGNGKEATSWMIDAFATSGLTDPYDASMRGLVNQKARQVAAGLLQRKRAAAEQDVARCGGFLRVTTVGRSRGKARAAWSFTASFFAGYRDPVEQSYGRFAPTQYRVPLPRMNTASPAKAGVATDSSPSFESARETNAFDARKTCIVPPLSMA